MLLVFFGTINNIDIVQPKYCSYLCKKIVMTFDKILDDRRLWAVKYDDENRAASYS